MAEAIVPRDNSIVWHPDPQVVAQSNIARFLAAAGIPTADPAGYRTLLQKADADPEWFWNLVIRETGVQFFKPYAQIMDTSRGIAWTEWCVGGTTNAALNCLDRHLQSATRDKEAIVWEAESGSVERWTYKRLGEHTSRLAEGLRQLGCKPGDVIGIYLPMVPEAVAAMLAVVKIGCVVLPLYSGFGPQAIATRLNDGGAVAVLAADGTWRRGKYVPLKDMIDDTVPLVPTLRHVVVLRNSGEPVRWNPEVDHWWDALCEGQSDAAPTTHMPAEAPMMLMFTSGTTGKPKGTVHSHCGFISKLALDMTLFMDLKPADRMLWMSDMGWLAGPMLVYGATFAGATIVLAEGVFDYPDEGRFWRLIQDNQVTLLGIAPTIVRSFIQAGGAGIADYDLNSLRLTFSTGEPWTHDAWMWMFTKVCGSRIPIINYSGGTEIGGGILTGTPLHPMKPGALSGPVPGMGVAVMDDNGTALTPPCTGELVVRKPSIGITRGLWNDPQRYLESYWTRFPGIWVHGDRVQVDADGFWYVLGRSDDTLKIAGKRTGPSEVESLVTATGLVAEVAAIGLPDSVKGSSLCIVATLMPGVPAEDGTRREIAQAVVAGHGRAYLPAVILFVPDIPKTRNLKIMRRVVRATYLDESPGDLSSMVNPESLDAIRQARDRQNPH